MSGWAAQLGGRFIVFDGPDGSGKSTQLGRFAAACRGAGAVVCTVREPGGTAIGEQIRRVLLDPANGEMSLRCETMLYMASRAQLLAQTIAPALARGELVLADRFVSSTLAYQGAAGGVSGEEIMQIARVALGALWPDLTVLLDVDEAEAAQRRGPLPDRMEGKGEAFHRRVREGFLAQARADPDRHLVVDASEGADAVARTIESGIRRRLGGEGNGVRG